jgi:outer membrane lipoprotein
MKTIYLLTLLLLLAGCAGSPLQLEGVNRSLNPAMVSPDHPQTGARVVWGGMIIKTDLLKAETQIEVLAFPLDDRGEPDRQATSLGRFIILHKGFLEPAEFASGHWVSVVGTVGQSKTGKVGAANYRFPVIVPEQLHLWPESGSSTTQTRFHFGIGIQF